MIDYEDFLPNRSYFAAANGFDGFRSLFGQLFAPEDHERIYILKGGPGTGKSTILKGLIKYANGEGIWAEAIYCSSDPYSLDAAVLCDGDKKVAVLDGTAPHTVDPLYPGAVERIVDLGDSFNIPYLTSRREDIVEISKRKKAAYRKAYNLLRSAGLVYEVISQQYLGLSDKKEIEKTVQRLIEHSEPRRSDRSPKKYLIGAFCRFGYTRIEEINPENKNAYYIEGNESEQNEIMCLLAKRLEECNAICAICPSPFSDKLIDAIYTENSLFIKKVMPPRETESLAERSYDQMKHFNSLLNASAEAFAEASEEHFKLENIYSDGVSFIQNDKIYEELLRNIEYDLE